MSRSYLRERKAETAPKKRREDKFSSRELLDATVVELSVCIVMMRGNYSI